MLDYLKYFTVNNHHKEFFMMVIKRIPKPHVKVLIPWV